MLWIPIYVIYVCRKKFNFTFFGINWKLLDLNTLVYIFQFMEYIEIKSLPLFNGYDRKVVDQWPAHAEPDWLPSCVLCSRLESSAYIYFEETHTKLNVQFLVCTSFKPFTQDTERKVVAVWGRCGKNRMEKWNYRWLLYWGLLNQCVAWPDWWIMRGVTGSHILHIVWIGQESAVMRNAVRVQG